MDKDFYKNKTLDKMTDEEWEALCDGCGRCCYRKILDGHLWNKKVYNTCVACDLLDMESGMCMDYENRFAKQKECIKLDRRKLKGFDWLPDTCAYRLIAQSKPLPEWHPLVSGTHDTVVDCGVMIKDGIHESDADDWYDYIIDVIH